MSCPVCFTISMKKRILLKKSDAINFFGNETAVAKAIGINKQAVNQWGDEVPELSAWPLYWISNEKLKAVINVKKNKAA